MLKQFIQNLNSIKTNENGFTLIELMVTLLVGMLVMVIGYSSMLTVRNAFLDDVSKIHVNQNARSALDVIGIATREAGENLDAYFPAIEVIEDGDNSRLVIRRNLLDEVLKLCTQIDQGSSNTEIYFAIPGTQQGCIRGDQLHNFNVWSNYRNNSINQVRAFIYDSSTKQGEFFTYIGEFDTGDSLYIQTEPHTWANDYSATSGAVYILEEWIFQMNDDILQIIENGKTDSPLNVANGFERFEVEINLQDNTIQNIFTPQENWTQIKGVKVRIKNNPVLTVKGKSIYNSEVSASFFPRNILSH